VNNIDGIQSMRMVYLLILLSGVTYATVWGAVVSTGGAPTVAGLLLALSQVRSNEKILWND
jgi:hypothetical protein